MMKKKNIHNSKLEGKNHTLFETKMAKTITVKSGKEKKLDTALFSEVVLLSKVACCLS